MTTDDTLQLSAQAQRRAHVLTRLLAGQCTATEAATLLSVSVRHLWRLKAAFARDGVRALVHGNRGQAKPWRISDVVKDRIRRLASDEYPDCNDSHLVDLLAREHGLLVSRASLRRILREAGQPAVRGRQAPRHRRRRDRYPQAGMLLQIDGSPHQWLGPERPRCTLIAAIDDATSSVVAAVFRAQEDAHGYFLLLRQIVTGHGRPTALYHDRHGIFRREPSAKWTVEEELAGRQEPTQFGRALEQLGIGSIAARSPQAKGRIERLWGTLQGRLVPELRLAGATSIEEAQALLPAFLERHNARFAVSADEPGSAYRPLTECPNGGSPVDLDQILSFRYPRVVNHDNTIRFDGQLLQIPAGPGRRGYARAHVFVHELLDGSVGVTHEQRWLLRNPAPSTAPVLRARSGPRALTAPSTAAPDTAPGTTPDSAPSSPAAAKPEAATTGTPPPKTPTRPSPSHPWRRGAVLPRATPTDRSTDQLAPDE
jgi:transposase